MKTLIGLLMLLSALMLPHSRISAMDLPEAGKKESASMVAGRKAVEAKDFKTAVPHFAKAVEEEPKNADAHTYWASVTARPVSSTNHWSFTKRL